MYVPRFIYSDVHGHTHACVETPTCSHTTSSPSELVLHVEVLCSHSLRTLGSTSLRLCHIRIQSQELPKSPAQPLTVTQRIRHSLSPTRTRPAALLRSWGAGAWWTGEWVWGRMISRHVGRGSPQGDVVASFFSSCSGTSQPVLHVKPWGRRSHGNQKCLFPGQFAMVCSTKC